MSIFVIGDLHLSFNSEKPMNIFGDKWQNYEEKLKNNWIETVKPEDTVVIPGDFSWCTYLEDTSEDFQYLEKLPGKKILLKGNHDYWWTTITSMRKYIKEMDFRTIDFLQNNAYFQDDYIIVGTRGWNINDIENQKIISREIGRLELSILNGIKKYGKDKRIIAFMHYPPIIKEKRNSGFLDIMRKYNVEKCFYGHLHGKSHQDAVEGNIEGIEMKLVSADYINFIPVKCLM